MEAFLEAGLKMVVALLLAMPTAIDREAHSRSVGLRTFPLVSLGACAYVILAQSVIGAPGDHPDAAARILQGLMTGMGFIGGGAILKGSNEVYGTASAASIWVTGAIGASVGFGQWWAAASLALVNFLVVFGLSFVKREANGDDA